MMREANFRLMAWAGLALLAIAVVSQPARAADEWPTRDITFYVPYAPGGWPAMTASSATSSSSWTTTSDGHH